MNQNEIIDPPKPGKVQLFLIDVIQGLGGKKFLMSVLGLLALALQRKIGMDPATILSIGGVVVSYLAMQWHLDAKTIDATVAVASDNNAHIQELKRIDAAIVDNAPAVLVPVLPGVSLPANAVAAAVAANQ